MPQILGQSPVASYSDPLASMPGTYAGPPLVLAPEVLGMAPPPPVAAAPLPPEALMSPMVPASVAAPMATLGAPPPAMAAPSAALPPPPAPMAPRRAQAAPAAPGGAALAPGFGDFAGTLAGVTAEAKRLAAQPRLSEIGTIRENLATTQERLAKEALGEAQVGAAEREAALTATQEAERASAAERTMLAGSAAEAARVAEENAAIERQRRAQAVEDTEKRFAAARDELDNTKIDVGAAYGSAGQRILSAVAIAMGAFGASITGGPNYALQIVNDRINRELDAQRSELEKKKGKVSELGRIFERNQNLLGDATQAANLTRAQTFRALADDVEARAKGRALAPQQAAALEQLRSQERANFAKLQEGIAMKSAEKAMVGAGERQAAAAAAAGETRRRRGILEKREEKAFETQLETQKAIDIEAAKKLIAEGGAGAPGEATPQAFDKVVETLAKPSIGVKNIVGALRSLSDWEGAIDAYGSAEAAPGGMTAGLAAKYTPSLMQAARALDEARLRGQLAYQVAVTGAGGSEEQMREIRKAAGGEDPLANKRYIDAERRKLLGSLETALAAAPPAQRSAIRSAILSQAGEGAAAAGAEARTGAKPITAPVR